MSAILSSCEPPEVHVGVSSSLINGLIVDLREAARQFDLVGELPLRQMCADAAVTLDAFRSTDDRAVPSSVPPMPSVPPGVGV
jgi:hypothetical protein